MGYKLGIKLWLYCPAQRPALIFGGDVKFRKKPVVIDAEQWFPGCNIHGVLEIEDNTGKYGVVSTLEGFMRVNPGDWIITGVKGEKYPCKPDVFEATYDPVEAM